MNKTKRVLTNLQATMAEQTEFIQTVTELLLSLDEVFEAHPEYEAQGILEKLTAPQRVLQFTVNWLDDDNKLQSNRGYRIQHNNCLGPYKGGLRLHPSVNLSILKSLAFEQTFKNALTTLNIGGAKGGSDFDPKGKSEAEIQRFCRSFIKELAPYIGATIDVPAGDMGVGAREIGYFRAAYQDFTGDNDLGVFTGKALDQGGSLVRKEATGYGLIYFVQAMAAANAIELKGKRTLVSGSGNVALHAIEKAQEAGLQVVGVSDSSGYLLSDKLDLAVLKEIKEAKRQTLQTYLAYYPDAQYGSGSIYDAGVPAEIILPCAKENEINKKQAQNLLGKGAIIIVEGANMPSDSEAVAVYHQNAVLYAPGKAANAGGVATSVLEMQQNQLGVTWPFVQVDRKLHDLMNNIHSQLLATMKKYRLEKHEYLKAANITAFERLAQALLEKQ